MENSGRPATAVCLGGALSVIVVAGWESPLPGEGPDRSTPPAQETRAGHAGSDHHEPTSLGEIANRAREIRSREGEYNRVTGCGKTARPGLCRGRRVTGVPAAEPKKGIIRYIFL